MKQIFLTNDKENDNTFIEIRNLYLINVTCILPDFPRCQQRTVLVEIGLSIPLVTSIPRLR